MPIPECQKQFNDMSIGFDTVYRHRTDRQTHKQICKTLSQIN